MRRLLISHTPEITITPYCLIDSSWDLNEVDEGKLHLSYVPDVREETLNKIKVRFPFVRAVVTKIFDKQNNIIHNWKGSMPIDLVENSKSTTIPWIKLPETIFPDPKGHQIINEVLKKYPCLNKVSKNPIGYSLKIVFFAIAHPIEIGHRKNGVGWIFIMRFGRSKEFKNKNTTMALLQTLRAGQGDIGYRVPAVQMLKKKRILVVGVGALGAPVAIELARNGCGHLHLIEHDVVEPGNTIRWPLGTSAWGKLKIAALEDFIKREYPATELNVVEHYIGLSGIDNSTDDGDDTILNKILAEVDIVVDGSASYGVTSLLGERCRQFDIPLISLFATPTIEGGVVVLHYGAGGCPTCLLHAWDHGDIVPPPGQIDFDDSLIQPPGCAERTFTGASYDLQELSLQAVRLAVETLSKDEADSSLVQTLSFVDEKGASCPPSI